MKEFLRLSAVLAALAACGSAHAGFLDPAPAYPVPSAGYPGYPVKSANIPPVVYDWTGFYVGINGGGSRTGYPTKPTIIKQKARKFARWRKRQRLKAKPSSFHSDGVRSKKPER